MSTAEVWKERSVSEVVWPVGCRTGKNPHFLITLVTKSQGHTIKILLEGGFNKRNSQVLGVWLSGVTRFHLSEEVELSYFTGWF